MIGSPREWAKDFAFWVLDQRKTRGYHLMNDLRFWTQDRSVEIIFDVRANVGQTVDRFREYFPSARIEAFEPFIETFETLQSKAAAFPNVRCHPFALSEVEDSKSIQLVTGRSRCHRGYQ